jgi:hypothetical protein
MERYAGPVLQDANLHNNPTQLARNILTEGTAGIYRIAKSTEHTAADAVKRINVVMSQPDWSRKLTIEAYDKVFEDVPPVFAIFLAPMMAPLLVAIISLLMTMYWMCSSYNPFYEEESSHVASIIPLLMILGPELVGKALAITTASSRNDSVCLGFGLLGYMYSLLTTAFTGSRDIVPKPEIDSKVLNLKSGQGRTNNSFVLSRVLRDLESPYAPKAGGLVIEVLEAVAPAAPLSSREVIKQNYHTVIISIAQFLMACGYTFFSGGDCSVLCIFSTSLFALHALTYLPAWTSQKFSARKDGGQNASYALMRGNGHRYVFVIRNTHPEAWNLEDLAGPGLTSYDYLKYHEIWVIGAVFFIFLFLTLLSTQLSYFGTVALLCITFYGTLGNLLIAGLPRAPWAHGVALESVEVIQNDGKVMGALQSLEEKYPGFGEPLVKEFFPGSLRQYEQNWWDERKAPRE